MSTSRLIEDPRRRACEMPGLRGSRSGSSRRGPVRGWATPLVLVVGPSSGLSGGRRRSNPTIAPKRSFVGSQLTEAKRASNPTMRASSRSSRQTRLSFGRRGFSSVRAVFARRLAEGVHIWNIESIRELIASFDGTLETLESSDAKLIPSDARARVSA